MRQRGGVLAGTVVLVLGAWQASPAVAQAIPFKAGIADASNSVLAWWMARDGGFYAQQGLDVEIRTAGGNRGLEELQAGRLDVMHRGLSNVVRVNRGGGDLRLIGSLGDKIRFVFFSAANVKTAAALKGGVVAVSDFGAEGDVAVTLGLKRLGLTRDDVMVKEIGDSAHQLVALKSGTAQAAMLGEPFAGMARDQGLNVLIDLQAEQIPWLFTGIAVEHKAIAPNRDKLKRFLRGTIEGNYLAFSDAARAKAVLAKELKITDPKILELSYADYKRQTPINVDMAPKAAENTLAQFTGVSTRLEDYIDASLIDEIKQEGFLAALQQKYAIR